MYKEGILGTIYTVMEWITKIAFLNILWWLGILVGLILFGFAPSTAAVFSVSRKWLTGKQDIPVFTTYIHTYRSEFLQSNFLCFPLYLFGYLLYINYQFVLIIEKTFYYPMLFVFVTALIFFIAISIYIFPVFVHYKNSILNYYRTALMVGFSYPFISLTMVVTFLLFGLLLERFVGLIPFFPVSLISVVWMHLSLIGFRKIRQVSTKSINS